MDIIRRIFKMCKPFQKHLWLGVIAVLIANATRLINPELMRRMIDDVIEGGKLELLLPLCVGMVLLSVVRATTNYFRGVQFEKLSQNFTYDMRTGLYEHLQSMPYEFYDKNYVGEIMSRMTGDIEGLRNLLAGGVIQILENLIWFFGSLFILFFVNVKLAVTMFAFAPAVALVAYLFSKKIRPAFRELREQNAVLSTRTQENISGVRVVKAFAREGYEEDAFRKENQLQLKHFINIAWIWTRYIPLLDFLGNAITPVLILVGGYLVITGEITLGVLVMFNSYTWMITGPMRNVGNLVNMLSTSITSGEKLFYYMDLGPSIKDRPQTVYPDEFTGHVRFNNVTFSYGEGVVLKDVSFEVKPGNTIAVMGATGTGKTSVVNLLSRFYECQKGSVTIDGVDVKDMPIKKLRDRIGYVNQETFLFSETIANNIAFGRPNVSMEKIQAAAKAAQAHDFILQMPQGYDTIVGERGVGLSGGQRQRIAIARALLYDPTILILDDSTSAVDMETEYLIQKELETIMDGRTTFIIAHRISSVKDADEIIILKDNIIAERGTHDSLLAQKGEYYQMVQDQYKDFAALDKGEVQ